ncbi:MAG TPA: peptidase, partial [Ktedonobacteraceae bacterium]|nr:peptidase [Ktedonobacteraceae bacterium]
MTSQGYVRFPNIHQHQIVFVSEDDLWLLSSEGGRAERLTAGVGEVSSPHFSPGGELLAFVGREEGPSEVYVMPALGGTAQRLTFQSASSCRVLGWSPDGKTILYASNAGQINRRYEVIFAVSPNGGMPHQVPVGMANAISYGPQGGVVLGRNIGEPARWKRYRGGTAGHLWCDPAGSGAFQRLLTLNGNLANPCWVGERIYFISDHEGVGNVYSCTPLGEDIRRHSDHNEFYARNLSSDDQRMVYHCGADLYLFDLATDYARRLDIELPSIRSQRNRKFVSASHYLDTYTLHPQGLAVALTTRGKAFSMANWEGPVIQHGLPDGARYRLLEWLSDGKRLVAVSDATGSERLIIFNPEEAGEPKMLTDIEFGRAVSLAVSPTNDVVAITNHRNELIVVDLENTQSVVADRSDHERIRGLSWSPDGRWLAYAFSHTAQKSAIKLCNMENGETHFATDPVFRDVAPAFDPEGKFLYFLGYRSFNPVYDNLQFDLGFPRGVRPYAITLQRDQLSPFIPQPKAPGEKDKEQRKEKEDTADQKAENGTEGTTPEAGEDEEKTTQKTAAMLIDLEGITTRAVPFPVNEARFAAIKGIKGKALLLSFPIEGTIHTPDNYEPRGALYMFDFETLRYEWLGDGINGFNLSRDSKTLIYRAHHHLRVLKAGEKFPKSEEGDDPSRENGWLDLHRVKVSVQPAAEWKQMFAEAWRLQREQFWSED